MAWLLDLSPVKSFDRLAQRLLDEPDWPERRHVRSLGNALRDLDQGAKREWFIENSDRITVLARVLGIAREDLQRRIGGVLALADLPGARPLDLVNDDLFPGINELLTTPFLWNSHVRVWWKAPPGSGKTLLGRWLEARGMARLYQCRDFTELKTPLADSDRMLVEVVGVEGWREFIRLQATARGALMVAAPVSLRELIERDAPTESDADAIPPTPATSFQVRAVDARPTTERRPRAEDRSRPSRPAVALPEAGLPRTLRELSENWVECAISRPSEWLGPLTRWVSDRYPKDRPLDATKLQHLCEDLVERGLIEVPGDVLSVAGLVERWGGPGPLLVGERGVLQDYLRSYTERLPPTMAGYDWFLENAEKLLTGILRRLFLDACARPEVTIDGIGVRGLPDATWADLIPADLVPDADVDGLRRLAEDAAARGQQVDPQAVQDRLAPSPAALVRTLQDAHILARQGDGVLVMRPRMLVTWLTQTVCQSIIDGGPAEFGEALLQLWAVDIVASGLEDRFKEGDWEPASRAVAELNLSDPARGAALETCFRLVGGAILAGANPPSELRRDLFSAAMRLAAHGREGDVELVPRLGWVGSPRLNGRGLWFAAGIALSEGDDCSRTGTLLSPWSLTDPPAGLGIVLEEALRDGAADRDRAEASWMAGLKRMGARLVQRFRVIECHNHICTLVAADVFAQAAKAGDVELAARAMDSNMSLRELRDASGRLQVDWSIIATEIWRRETNAVRVGSWQRAEPEDVASLWPYAPSDVVVQVLKNGGSLRPRWDQLSHAQWAAVVGAIHGIGEDRYVDAEGWRLVPLDFLEQLARTKILGYHFAGLPILWERAGEQLIAIGIKLLVEDPSVHGAGGYTLWSATDRYVPSIQARLRAWAGEVPERREHYRQWLQFVIERRKSGWREAYRELAMMSVGGDHS